MIDLHIYVVQTCISGLSISLHSKDILANKLLIDPDIIVIVNWEFRKQLSGETNSWLDVYLFFYRLDHIMVPSLLAGRSFKHIKMHKVLRLLVLILLKAINPILHLRNCNS